MFLNRFRRIDLGHFPTPLERLDKLSAMLGGPEIWIKRDDSTGLATGGNKTRKLEFLLADALERGADTIVTQGATQSNHVRQTAAAAARCGLRCVALLERRVEGLGAAYGVTGNVFLDELFECSLEEREDGADMNAEVEDKAEALRVSGLSPYVIPGGGSNATGALGYVRCMHELAVQLDGADLHVDAIVHATGSAGTQAGLVAGALMLGGAIPVLGVSVRAPRERQIANVTRVTEETLELLGMPALLHDRAIDVVDDYVGPGYGYPTDETLAAIRLLATVEGILLDPVYSAKGFAGLLDMIRNGRFRRGEQVVFVHTGGAAVLPAYEKLLRDHRSETASQNPSFNNRPSNQKELSK